VAHIETERNIFVRRNTKIKMAKIKKPKLGDRIEFNSPFSEVYNKGTVTQILSQQFVFTDDSGLTQYCLFKGSWRRIKDE
jgi:hypothetical protein